MGISSIEPEILIKPQPFTISFTGKEGMITTRIPHDYLNALRLVLMQNTLYPRHEWNKQTRVINFTIPNLSMHYSGWGPMESDTVGIMKYVKTADGTIRFQFSAFSFDVSPFIINREDGSIEYLPPYDYYHEKTTFIVTFQSGHYEMDPIIEKLNKVLPYERFSRLNRPALSFIQTQEQKI